MQPVGKHRGAIAIIVAFFLRLTNRPPAARLGPSTRSDDEDGPLRPSRPIDPLHWG